MRVALLPTLLLAAILLPAGSLPSGPRGAKAQESANWIPGKTAKLQALDKVTAQVTVLDAAVDKPTKFGTLSITVRACDYHPPDEVPDAAAFIEVRDTLAPRDAPPAFRGWMLANAPAVNMLEHPVYDLRILECR
ncbi:DUF2155 domain-containing protein [Roseomonas gilardii]|uniref:DUF2155 domain-containing protein n=1 Tax=Roseomonas gilardii TaxID=257708 RepID=UPI00047F73B6|nr:DUF2155 domain-containing protein [Roseomonas gilardii]SUE44765.1 Uncharacterized protein conserved in bacteria (DUF2155) [Roseomonas gilardii subsp. rosea]